MVWAVRTLRLICTGPCAGHQPGFRRSLPAEREGEEPTARARPRQLVAVSVVLGSVSVIHRTGSPERLGFTLSVAALPALGTGTFAEWTNEG